MKKLVKSSEVSVMECIYGWTYELRQFWLDVWVEDVPPLLEVFQGVSLERSGLRLALWVELDVPRLRRADEVNDLHLVAVAAETNVKLETFFYELFCQFYLTFKVTGDLLLYVQGYGWSLS